MQDGPSLSLDDQWESESSCLTLYQEVVQLAGLERMCLTDFHELNWKVWYNKAGMAHGETADQIWCVMLLSVTLCCCRRTSLKSIRTRRNECAPVYAVFILSSTECTSKNVLMCTHFSCQFSHKFKLCDFSRLEQIQNMKLCNSSLRYLSNHAVY